MDYVIGAPIAILTPLLGWAVSNQITNAAVGAHPLYPDNDQKLNEYLLNTAEYEQKSALISFITTIVFVSLLLFIAAKANSYAISVGLSVGSLVAMLISVFSLVTSSTPEVRTVLLAAAFAGSVVLINQLAQTNSPVRLKFDSLRNYRS